MWAAGGAWVGRRVEHCVCGVGAGVLGWAVFRRLGGVWEAMVCAAGAPANGNETSLPALSSRLLVCLA